MTKAPARAMKRHKTKPDRRAKQRCNSKAGAKERARRREEGALGMSWSRLGGPRGDLELVNPVAPGPLLVSCSEHQEQAADQHQPDEESVRSGQRHVGQYPR